jgi:hypothetical protein
MIYDDDESHYHSQVNEMKGVVFLNAIYDGDEIRYHLRTSEMRVTVFLSVFYDGGGGDDDEMSFSLSERRMMNVENGDAPMYVLNNNK